MLTGSARKSMFRPWEVFSQWGGWENSTGLQELEEKLGLLQTLIHGHPHTLPAVSDSSPLQQPTFDPVDTQWIWGTLYCIVKVSCMMQLFLADLSYVVIFIIILND